MKLAIFTDAFTPQVNGIVTSLISQIKKLADRGHKIIIIAPKYPQELEEFKYPGIKVIRIPSIKAYFYPEFRFTSLFTMQLYRYLKKENVDLINFQAPVGLGFQAILISKLLKKPLIGTFNTFIAHRDYLKHLGFSGEIMEKVGWMYLRFFYNKCNKIICQSPNTKRELIKHRLKKPIKVISYGIETSPQKIPKKDKKQVLFIGRIAHEKNIEYLIDVFKIIKKQDPEIKLKIVGDGPQMNKIKSRIINEGLKESIELTGNIENEKLLKSNLFSDSTLFVTASLTENLPVTLLEAQARGLICLGLKQGRLDSLIINGYNGYLLEDGDKIGFANKIIELLENKKECSRLRKNTLEEIKKHDINKIINLYEQEYMRVIEEFHNSS